VSYSVTHTDMSSSAISSGISHATSTPFSFMFSTRSCAADGEPGHLTLSMADKSLSQAHNTGSSPLRSDQRLPSACKTCPATAYSETYHAYTHPYFTNAAPLAGLLAIPVAGIIIIIIINDSIYPAVSKASRTGNKVSCQSNDCPNR